MDIRACKYGLIPIGFPPQTAIDELWGANNLWNTLIVLQRESCENWDDARHAAFMDYSENMSELENKLEDNSHTFNTFF